VLLSPNPNKKPAPTTLGTRYVALCVPVRASPQLCAENCSCGGGRRGAGNRNPEGMVLSLVARRRPWIPIPILPPPPPDAGHGQPTEPPVLPPSINGQQRPACCLLCFHSSLFKPHQDRDCCCCRNRNRTDTDTDTERRLSIPPLLASAWTITTSITQQQSPAFCACKI
jgi:hypothetical protein